MSDNRHYDKPAVGAFPQVNLVFTRRQPLGCVNPAPAMYEYAPHSASQHGPCRADRVPAGADPVVYLEGPLPWPLRSRAPASASSTQRRTGSVGRGDPSGARTPETPTGYPATPASADWHSSPGMIDDRRRLTSGSPTLRTRRPQLPASDLAGECHVALPIAQLLGFFEQYRCPKVRIIGQPLPNIRFELVERIRLRRSPLTRCPLPRQVSSYCLSVSSQMPGDSRDRPTLLRQTRVLPRILPVPTSAVGLPLLAAARRQRSPSKPFPVEVGIPGRRVATRRRPTSGPSRLVLTTPSVAVDQLLTAGFSAAPSVAPSKGVPTRNQEPLEC